MVSNNTDTSIIAIDSEGIRHITKKGHGSQYCRDRKINLDWSSVTSTEGIVLAGGIYFKCIECGTTGVLTNSTFTQDLKHKAGVASHSPFGIEFFSCDNHEGINEDE